MITWITWFLLVFLLFALDYLRKSFSFPKHPDLFSHILLLGVILFAGFRYKIGNDYDNYVLLYNATASNPLETYVEPGFSYFCYLLNLAGLSAQSMFFLFSTATLLLVYRTVQKYSVHPAMSFMIFLLAPAFFFNSLAIVRQFFVVAAIFATIPFIIERKFWKFFLCVLLLSPIHKSAVIMIFFYFLAPLKINKYIFIAALAAVVIYPPSRLVDHLYLLKDYDEYLVSKAPEFGLGTTMIFRGIIFMFVLLASDRFEDRTNKIIVNLYLMGVIFYFATLGTEALSRISLYLSIFEIIAVINTIYLFGRTDRIRMGLIYVTYCALAFFQNLHGYSAYYNKGTSEGNINYEMNFQLLK